MGQKTSQINSNQELCFLWQYSMLLWHFYLEILLKPREYKQWKTKSLLFPPKSSWISPTFLFPAARRGVRGESGRVYSEGLRSHSEGLRWALPLDKSPLSPFRFKMFLDTFQTYALNSTSKVIIFFPRLSLECKKAIHCMVEYLPRQASWVSRSSHLLYQRETDH